MNYEINEDNWQIGRLRKRYYIITSKKHHSDQHVYIQFIAFMIEL